VLLKFGSYAGFVLSEFCHIVTTVFEVKGVMFISVYDTNIKSRLSVEVCAIV